MKNKLVVFLLCLGLFGCSQQPAFKVPDSVTGVFIDKGGKNYAIVNDEVVREGITIDDVKIIKINKDSVDIEVNGENKNIRLGGVIPFHHKTNSEEIVKDKQTGELNKVENKTGFGGFTGSKHYEKALSLKGMRNYEGALEEAKLSLKYDYVTSEMKKALDSIIATCNEYNQNVFLKNQAIHEKELERNAKIYNSKVVAEEAARKTAFKASLEASRAGSAARKARALANAGVLHQSVAAQANVAANAARIESIEAERNVLRNQPPTITTYADEAAMKAAYDEETKRTPIVRPVSQ